MATGGEKADGERRRMLRFAPLCVLALLLAAGYALGWHERLTLSALAESRAALHEYTHAHPVLAPAAFLLVYTLAVAASFPAASLLTVFGGFLFGWLMGGTLVVLAATIGASVLFLAARTACGDVLRRRVGGRAARLAKGFEEGAFGYLLVLRLAPVFPFWVVNVVPALFDVRLKTFVAATALGIIPGTFAYAYLGCGLESALIAAETAGQDVHLRDLVTTEMKIAFLALALVAGFAVIVKKLRVAG